MKWFGQIVSWASTIVVARLLEPTDYGVVGMATLFLGLVTLVNEFGFGAAIIAHRGLSADPSARRSTALPLSLASWRTPWWRCRRTAGDVLRHP